VASYNLENYLLEPVAYRPAKSEAAKGKVREAIRVLSPDVLALQEIGDRAALLELRASLRVEGLDYPYWEHVKGYDTNIFVAVLSRFPITDRRSHTDDSYLVEGRRFRLSRGFAEVDIRVNARYTFTLLNAHLKSRRPVSYADQAGMREQEAVLLREKVEAILARRPAANVIVLGDFNDTKNSPAVRTIAGRGAKALTDTRPAERNGDTVGSPRPDWDPRRITWTYSYGVEDSYERIDYIFLSPGMTREWEPGGTFVLALPNWGLASDHRPIIAAFHAADR
jgi:endonuclease/exonuclease/phosphatase family metal-dependent hydrolase